MSERYNYLLSTTDASEWARAFMTKIRTFLIALVAALTVLPGIAHAGVVPITPAVTSCSAPVLGFFNNRTCVDPTASGSRRVYIFTNNVLVASFPLQLQTGTGCTAGASISSAWFPFTSSSNPAGTSVGAIGYLPNGVFVGVNISSYYIPSCGAAPGPFNYYKAPASTVAALAAVAGTHTLVHVH
jgi:hypothetical protein